MLLKPLHIQSIPIQKGVTEIFQDNYGRTAQSYSTYKTSPFRYSPSGW